jgi:hypothetical protein
MGEMALEDIASRQTVTGHINARRHHFQYQIKE